MALDFRIRQAYYLDMNRVKCLQCGRLTTVPKNNPRKKFCSKKCVRKHFYIHNKERERSMNRRWYLIHRDSEILKNKEYREQNRELFNWYHNKDRFNGIRDIILKRDQYKCRVCNCNSDKRLSVHHKDGTGYFMRMKLGITSNNDIANLITLCNSCHHILHHYQRKTGTILFQDEDIVRTLKRLRDNKLARIPNLQRNGH